MTTTSTLREWFISPLQEPSILVLDGGVSTYLEHVLAEREERFAHRELWSSSLLLTEQGCRDIQDCHQAFLTAGADIVSTVTYQCHYGCKVVSDPVMTDMLRKGIQRAKAAVQAVGKDNKYVAVSLGCYGAALADGSEYRGDYQVSDAELTRFHKDRLETALQESPDAIAFETIPQALEVEQVAQLLLMMKEPAMDSVATWISVSCRNGSDLNDGTPLTNVLQRLRHVDPDGRHVHGIGINCCAGQHIASLLQIIAKDMAIHGPRRVILVYPNSGEEFDAVANDWKEGSGCATALEFAAMMRQGLRAVEETWTQHGDGPLPKMVVGGCCRTSPATIAALRTVLEERLHSR